MSKFPKVFNNIYTSAILAGESSASLPSIFSDLSEFIDKEEKIKSQVTSVTCLSNLTFGSIASGYLCISFSCTSASG